MKPINLQTKRLLLRRANGQDAEVLFENYLSLPERSHFLCRKPYTHIDQAKNFIKQWCDLPWVTQKNKFAWVIASLNENKAIGLFLTEHNNDNVEIHYGISKEFENQGLTTEAGMAAIEWLSSHNTVKKIHAHCDLENMGSQTVLKNLGFKNKGVLKNYLILPMLGPSPRDCFVFEYAASNKAK